MLVERRPFVAVLFANVISITGNALTFLGVPWFVLQSTGSAGKTGIVSFCTGLPVVLSAIAGGPVIDRVGRLRVAVGSDLICGAAIAAIPLLHFADVLRLWMLCVLMAVTGLFRSPSATARGALLPRLAESADVAFSRAAGLYDSASRCAGTVGAAIGGVLIGLVGAANVLFLDAVTFALSALILVLGLRGVPAAQPQPHGEARSLQTYRDELREGYRYLMTTPLLLSICLMSVATKGLDQSWSAVLLPVHVRDQLGGALDLGLLNALFGAGALLGALTYGAIGHRFRRWPLFTIAFLIVGAPRFFVAALTHTVPPLAVMMAIEGLACGVINPILAIVTYETVPERLRSRVLSATTASVLMITPLGSLAGGLMVGSAGVNSALLVTGGAYLLATLSPVIYPSWRHLDRPVQADPIRVQHPG
ncbi:MAG: MFS transporter [Mycobacterium sp.]|nr:MFS transporter [Mycobacterium sp.]